MLEQVDSSKTLIFDKTGTLTYGEPRLSGLLVAPGFDRDELLTLTESVERYSKHPLARAVLRAATDAGISLLDAAEVNDSPGKGLQ